MITKEQKKKIKYLIADYEQILNEDLYWCERQIEKMYRNGGVSPSSKSRLENFKATKNNALAKLQTLSFLKEYFNV